MMIDEHGVYVMQPELKEGCGVTLSQACAALSAAQKIVPGIQLYGEDGGGGVVIYALALSAPGSGFSLVSCPA
jgi:hypothetical protein